MKIIVTIMKVTHDSCKPNDTDSTDFGIQAMHLMSTLNRAPSLIVTVAHAKAVHSAWNCKLSVTRLGVSCCPRRHARQVDKRWENKDAARKAKVAGLVPKEPNMA